MALLKILEYPDPRLREKSVAVTEFTSELARLVDDMHETMNAAKGIGLAAVQIGVHKRVIVMDIGDLSTDQEYIEGDQESERRLSERRSFSKLEVYINPEIINSDGDITYEEGCLSVPGVTAEVQRKEHLRVRYVDLQGKTQEIETHGLRSIALQHEIDHMNGIVFPDRLGPMKRMMLLNKYKKLQLEKAEEDLEADKIGNKEET